MPKYNLTSGLPSYPAGLSDKDAGLVMPLYRAINSLTEQVAALTGRVEYTAAEQAGIDQFAKLTSHRTQKVIVKAAEFLPFGTLLNLIIADGKVVARKADATDRAKPAHAIADMPFGINSGEFGEAIFMQGKSSGIGGTAFGASYYLSTNGLAQAVAPVATGVLNQFVGIGLGSAGFYFNVEPVGRRVSYVYKFNALTLRVLYTDGHHEDVPI